MSFEPIAIVGRACVLPGALNPAELWEAVRAGRDLVTSAPAGRWRVARSRILGQPGQAADRTWTDRGGYVTGFEQVFDPSGFALPAEELVGLDPLFQWLLHVSREALRDAGLEGSARAGAVFGNLSFPSASMARFAERVWLGEALADLAGIPKTDARNRFMSGLPAHLVARALGLGAGSFAIDAACASSLYAIKLACDRLHDRSADLMLAGAVNCADDLFIHVGFCALQAMSRTGQSRPFHREADGLLPAEGAAAVALMRLEDAERAGHRILGVIRGIGLSNDGRGRGLLVPSEEGQVRAMRAAYEASGLRPADVSLIECHATGTSVGDAAEVRSMRQVFEGARDLPIGSLKSNFGHAITAAGVSGLLKVLGAIEARVRPPTLHADEPVAELADSPFRLVREAEPWESEAPLRAAVSAFGFGGNNAHLIVEEHRPSASPRARAARSPGKEVAIVAIGAAVGRGHECADFEEALFSPERERAGRAESISLPLAGTRFTPHDLDKALAQQTWLLAASREALSGLRAATGARAGVFVGMGCDPEVARYGARWRLADWADAWGEHDAAWRRAAAEAFTSVLEPAGVLGTMPNMPANRLNAQFDLGGMGFAVSAEELSGVRALEIAARALAAGELDLALVGAADFSCEPVHEAALGALVGAARPGDGAVVLALERVEDARRNGDPILAILGGPDEGAVEPAVEELESRFGRAHAAFGLIRVAAAALSCARGRHVGGAPWTGPRAAKLVIDALGGERATVVLRSAGAETVAPRSPTASAAGPTRDYTAHKPQVALPDWPEDECAAHARLAPPEPPSETQTMPRAPALPPVLEGEEEPVMEPEERVVPRQATRIVAPAPVAPAAASSVAPAELAAQYALVASVHRQFIEQQAQAHRKFLELREQAARVLMQAAGAAPGGGAGAPPSTASQGPASAHPERSLPRNEGGGVEGPSTSASQARTALGLTGDRSKDSSTHLHSPSGGAGAPPSTPSQGPASAHPERSLPRNEGGGVEGPSASASQARTALGLTGDRSKDSSTHLHSPSGGAGAPPSTLPGPKLDRPGLEIHASGRISEIYGPLFEKQDGFARQVRMPEPPLLLADRLLGIDAEPGSMGLGTLWTETDVHADSWYLHDGRMPAGIMIEAGQADLMLISYLGIDFLNRGERVYRLLGCDLTYHGSLPAPGDTLRYDIHVDGHAQHGDVRLFFFHYDCRIDGQPRLSVRHGQAGFFSDTELADSKGVLWDAESGERRDDVRLDPPAVELKRSSFGREQLEAFAAGRIPDCFGPELAYAHTHTRSPRIAGGKMLLLEEVTDFSPRGGPWGRGYLRAVDRIAPDDWFFEGHFKNDPCMPGTLMFEGCLQAMAVYLTALGYTLDKDGWRFEPVPEETYKLRCRGQATPSSHELVYEVFVEEVIAGPIPTLYADLLVTVDGLKAFHCRRMGLRLVPGWPLDSKPELVASLVDARPVASENGFEFGARSLLACAWGKPSDAFGPMYAPFDGPRRVPRLPGPPYQFMSRISRVEGGIGAMKVGSIVECEYDVPPDAWYFDANGARTMPFCVLLEAALQPCGWLASYIGSATTTEHDLSFRNLDGQGRVLAEVLPDAGIFRTRSKLTNVSGSAGMIIVSFDVTCLVGETPVYELKTVFGFFPKEALEAQKGLPVPADEREALTAPSDECVDLRARPERWFARGPKLADPMLCMIDRVTGIWPQGGAKGLGRFRAEHDVRKDAWFFKAHFFQDPVQPGSLGLEAMLQLLQFAMIRLGLADGEWSNGRFEPIAIGVEQTWKYRGQVLPRNERVTTLLDIVRIDKDERGRLAVADASLWVDGMRIYEAKGLGMRITRPESADPTTASLDSGATCGRHYVRDDRGRSVAPAGRLYARDDQERDNETLDPSIHTWLADHRPTWTVPALPLMSMVDRLAAAAARRAPSKRVVAIEDARALRWLPVPGPVRLRTDVEPAADGAFDATLLAWRDAARAELSRFEPAASGRVVLADRYPEPESPWAPPADARPVPDPYEAGSLFHGPSFQLLRTLAIGGSGSTATLDAAASGAPRGLLHETLLDALTHGIPHDGLHVWSPEIAPDLVAYPHRATLRLFGELPREGLLRLETRFAGFDGDPRFPKLEVQAIAGDRVVAHLALVEVLFPKGPIGTAEPRARRAFLRDRAYAEGVRLSTDDGVTTRLAAEAVRASDWLPGTIAAAYAAAPGDIGAIAAKEHVAARARVHPATVRLVNDGQAARCEAEPLTLRPLEIEVAGDEATVRDTDEPRLDLSPVRDYWARYFHIGRWPVEDLYFGMAERFVRRVRVEDPSALAAYRGRPFLFVGNHQVGIESLMFSLLNAGLTGVPTLTLAKAEHRTTWLGLLIKHAFAYPGAHDPGVITYFQRDDPDQLPVVIAELAEELKRGKSVMVHVEGTRALSCRPPVIKMSGAFLDMAIAVGAPVVPVRFVGGLPVEPLAKRIEFPVGMGRQDLYFGRPMLPQELAALPYKERKERVIAAINALGPPNAVEEPLPGDPAFAALVDERVRRTGASHEHATLLEVLRELRDPHPEIRELIEAEDEGLLALAGDGKGRWLAELARRLYGERGARVVVGGR